MTVQQLFDTTTSMLGLNASNASTYLETLIGQVNTLLADCYNLENNNRRALGLTELTTIPTVAVIGDTIPYQDSIVRKVMIWGLAQMFAIIDDEMNRATYYGIRFADGLRGESKAIPTDIEDYYGTEEV